MRRVRGQILVGQIGRETVGGLQPKGRPDTLGTAVGAIARHNVANVVDTIAVGYGRKPERYAAVERQGYAALHIVPRAARHGRLGIAFDCIEARAPRCEGDSARRR